MSAELNHTRKHPDSRRLAQNRFSLGLKPQRARWRRPVHFIPYDRPGVVSPIMLIGSIIILEISSLSLRVPLKQLYTPCLLHASCVRFLQGRRLLSLPYIIAYVTYNALINLRYR